MINYREIAKSVIKLAVDIDHRVQVPTRDRIDAWAKLFDGQVWPNEAEAAVAAHYRDPKAFPLLPGDVIAYCQQQPVWSSYEHAYEWVHRFALRNPYSGAIGLSSGILEPAIDIPESVPRSEHKAYLIEKLTEWVTPRIDEIVNAILSKRFDPQAPQ